MNIKYRPRNDWVLVKVSEVGESAGGVALPQISAQAKCFYVAAIGPKVEDLSVGDKVILSGLVHADYYEIPGAKGLIAVQEKNVVLVEGK